MRKVIAFILSGYLIILSAVPCCLFDNCPEDKTEQSANHNEGDGDCGNCSPFFSCSGCGGFGFTVELLNFQPALVAVDKIITGYIESPVPDLPSDFWQPPRYA
jgi:hypothetical protein